MLRRLYTWWNYHKVMWWLTNPLINWNPRLVVFIHKRINFMQTVGDYKGLRRMAELLAGEANQKQSPLLICERTTHV